MLNQNLSILLKQQITTTLSILLTLGNFSASQNSIYGQTTQEEKKIEHYSSRLWHLILTNKNKMVSNY